MSHRRALAAVRPCELYTHGDTPRPSRTQGHHVIAEFLQRRVYGKTVDEQVIWLCGLCHDSVHDWLMWLLGEWREPLPHPSPRAKKCAQIAFDWYLEHAAA